MALLSLLLGMVDPGIDIPGEPFSWFARPTTVLGVADGPEGTQVTPEGWLYTGSAELMFFVGDPPSPWRKRIKTLLHGYLPVVRFSDRFDGVLYEATMFAWTVEGIPWENHVNFVRITLRNPTDGPKQAHLAVAVRGYGPDHRCKRMRLPFDWTRATYSFGPFYAVRDGRLIYTFPTDPKPSLCIVPDRPHKGPIKASEEFVTPNAPVCMVKYSLKLPPGGSASLVFKMPYFPIPLDEKGQIDALRRANFKALLREAVKFWEGFVKEGLVIELPERKVVEAYRANLIYDAIARDKVGKNYIVKVNEFQYDGFWIRDGSYIVRTFDLYGHHKWAEQALDYFLKWQREDGIIQHESPDNWGQALWALGQHFKITRNIRWARKVYPKVAKAVRGVLSATERDEMGVSPPSWPYDNEMIQGRYTGHNFWDITGIRDCVFMARSLGMEEDAREFERRLRAYEQRFLNLLHKVTSETGGYIPPGLDAPDGCDWGNLLFSYPPGGHPCRGVLDPLDPRALKTVNLMREHKYREGLMTYGRGLKPSNTLHHYLTMKVTEELLLQGRQKEVLEDFYSILVHTGSTHEGFEGADWRARDYGENYPPHGWFAAKFCALLRNMLVREWMGEVHLFSVLSPAWLVPGGRIKVVGAPTDYGRVTVVADVLPDGLDISLEADLWGMPRAFVVHTPWFVKVKGAEADGRPVRLEPARGQGEVLRVPPSTRRVRIWWQWVEHVPMSYERAVESYKRYYREVFEDYVKLGEGPEPLWRERKIPMTREERKATWRLIQKRTGIAFMKRAVASSHEPGHPPEMAVDGLVDRSSYWGASPYPQWWMVDLGEVRRIDRIRVVTYWDGARFYRYRVYISKDGRKWRLVADMSRNQRRSTPEGFWHAFPPVEARFVKVEMLYNSANPGVHLVEVMVFPSWGSRPARPPGRSRVVWRAREQAGAGPINVPSWNFVGAERIVIEGRFLKGGGKKVRLKFVAGRERPIVVGNVSIARVDPESPCDVLEGSIVKLTFDGGAPFTEVPAGGEKWTDWAEFDLKPGEDYAVTFYVAQRGSTVLWPSGKVKRFESAHPGAVETAKWSEIPHAKTYNLYFVSEIEAGE